MVDSSDGRITCFPEHDNLQDLYCLGLTRLKGLTPECCDPQSQLFERLSHGSRVSPGCTTFCTVAKELRKNTVP